MVIPGLHLTLGIFLKIFKVFDKECRRLDFRIGHKEGDDEKLEEVMDNLFFTEDKIFSFQESLASCTEIFFQQLSQLDDEEGRDEENDAEEDERRKQLREKYTNHRDKVENIIKKLVCIFN